MKSEIKNSVIQNAKVYGAIKNIDNGNLRSALEEMAKDANTVKDNVLTPKDLADLVMVEVESYQNIYSEVTENVEDAMEKVFKTLAESDLEPEKRVDIMNQMLFGFELFGDEEKLAQLKNGVSGESLYRAQCNDAPDYSANAELRLKSELMNKATNLRLSPSALKRMSNSLCYSDDYVAAAARWGASSYELKCVVAMDLYLRNNITIDEAAMNASVYVDLGDIADGVRVGDVAEVIAVGLTVAHVIAIAIQAVAMIAAAPTLGEMVVIGVMGYFLMEGVTMIGMFLSRQVGKLAAAGTPLVKNSVKSLKEGFDRIISAAEKEQQDDDDMWCYSDEQLHNLETEADYIF